MGTITHPLPPPQRGLLRLLHKFNSLMCGQENSCGKKIDYRSATSAQRAAIKFGKKVGRAFEPYNCWFCSGWHIGGAHNLTLKKFLRIFWFWIVKRKRTG